MKYLSADIKDPNLRLVTRLLTKNLSSAILSFNARSAMIQPAAILNATSYLPMNSIWWGMKEVFKPDQQKFIRNYASHLISRKFDVAVTSLKEELAPMLEKYATTKHWGKLKATGGKAVAEATDFMGKVGEVGLWPLKTLDFITSEMVGLAAYHHGSQHLKLNGEKLRQYVSEIIVRTQASGAIGDIPKIQREPLFRMLFSISNLYHFSTSNLQRCSLSVYSSDEVKTKRLVEI